MASKSKQTDVGNVKKRHGTGSKSMNASVMPMSDHVYDVDCADGDVTAGPEVADDAEDSNEIIGVLETPPVGTTLLLGFQVCTQELYFFW